MSDLKLFPPIRLPEVLALDDFKAGRFATSGMSMQSEPKLINRG